LLLNEYAETFTNDDDFRVYPITYNSLKESGTTYKNENDKQFGKGNYEGSKWLSLYLRAPEIYSNLLKNDKITTLSDFGKITLGITTCQNDYFYLDQTTISKFKLPNMYFNIIFRSPQESKRILLNESEFDYRVFLCNEKKIMDPNIKNYIAYGLKQKVHQVKCLQSRELWYNIGNPLKSNIILPYSYNDTFKVFYSKSSLLCDKRLVQFFPNEKDDSLSIALMMNSTLWALFTEVNGTTNLGEGALVFNTKDFRKFPFFHYKFSVERIEYFYNTLFKREIGSIFAELNIDKHKNIRSQKLNPLPDRKALDDIIFDALGLSQAEREEVYYAVCELVQNRINKAKSV